MRCNLFQNINDLKNIHQSIKQKALAIGLTVQSYILIVQGSIFEDETLKMFKVS